MLGESKINKFKGNDWRTYWYAFKNGVAKLLKIRTGRSSIFNKSSNENRDFDERWKAKWKIGARLGRVELSSS